MKHTVQPNEGFFAFWREALALPSEWFRSDAERMGDVVAIVIVIIALAIYRREMKRGRRN